MAKTLMQIFSRYLPDGENRRLMENAYLHGNMRVDKNARILEVDFSYSSLIPKSSNHFLQYERQYSNHSRSVPGLQKNSSSICSNSRVLKVKLPGVISFLNDLPT
jgi:hypothetical protein